MAESNYWIEHFVTYSSGRNSGVHQATKEYEIEVSDSTDFNPSPSTMNANKVGTPIQTEILFNRIQVRITTTMRMRKSVVIVYPKQMIPAAPPVVQTPHAADN